eukprot:COSAG02_NODE_5860_length_3981_cov_43.893137_5_plen_104_part_00
MTECVTKHSAQIKIDLFPQMRAGWRGSWCGRFENFKLLYFFAKYTHHYFYNENPVWTDGRAHPRGFRFHHNYRGTGIPIGLAVIAEVVTKTTTSNPALVRNRR